MPCIGLTLDFALSSTLYGILDCLREGCMCLTHLDPKKLFLPKEGRKVIERIILCIQIPSSFSALQVFMYTGLCYISKQF